MNNRELTVRLDPRETAVNWSLGSGDAFATPPSENSGRRNHFTVLDAREAMFRALTGQRLTDPVKDIGPGDTGSAPNNAAEAEAFRKAYRATTFRALGDVMHLIEDMAQPQHTRNDQHSGLCFPFVQDLLTGHKSVYEDRMKARTLNGREYNSATASAIHLDVPAADTHGYLLDSRIYDAMADLLVPRGVAYSAGFLNYFFRGRLEVKPSSNGIYALLDHAVTNQANDGFSTVKLQLRNAAVDINDGSGVYPQEMTNGTLFAVAKFRRNPCYQADLSGEVDTTGNAINGCSTTPNPSAVEEIVVSEPIASASLSRSAFANFVFDFSQNPIPLQATDLYLQVVYRGPLGTESDAVVVETVDLFEPTFVTLANSSDFRIENSLFIPVDDVAVDSFTIGNLQVGFSEISNETIAGLSALPVGNFVRLAILTDNNPFILTIRGETPSGLVVNRSKTWFARTAQRAADGSFNPDPLPLDLDIFNPPSP